MSIITLTTRLDRLARHKHTRMIDCTGARERLLAKVKTLGNEDGDPSLDEETRHEAIARLKDQLQERVRAIEQSGVRFYNSEYS